MMPDPWAILAVACAFAGGWVLGRRVMWQGIDAAIEGEIRSKIDAAAADSRKRFRELRIVVVNRGRQIQQVARIHRTILAHFGMAGIADQIEALADGLVKCDDPDDPVPPVTP